jgi:hypothetical protein
MNIKIYKKIFKKSTKKLSKIFKNYDDLIFILLILFKNFTILFKKKLMIHNNIIKIII